MYAIIETGGKQIKVAKGDKIFVEKLDIEEGQAVTFDKVVLVGGASVVIGTPYVANASVKATVVKQGKNKKIIIFRYRNKHNIHKKNGHRQPYTLVTIDEITA